MIKKNILEIPRIGVIGSHLVILPQNRGRHQLIWVLALGLEKTASYIFFMDEGVDSGDILSQEPINISYSDDAGSLYEKIEHKAVKQIERFLTQLEKRNFYRYPQIHEKANVWRKRRMNDGLSTFG